MRKRWARQKTLAEAALFVALARILLAGGRLRRLSAASRRLSRWPFAAAALPDDPVAALRWAVARVSPSLGASCLPQSLALQWLLARRGIAARVCIGVRVTGAPFPAHAWVEIDGRSEARGEGEGYARLCELAGT
jgi:hypothetical protein